MLSTRFALISLAAVASAFSVGCADPEGLYNDFGQRYEQAHPPIDAGPGCGHAACMPPAPMEIDGNFLMSLSVNLATTKPVLFLAKVTTPSSSGASGVALSMNIQALKTSDRMTPTGSAADVGPFDIGQDGQFKSGTLGPLTIPGDANSITGADAIAEPTLCGHVCKDEPDFMCGDVGGQVTKPITDDLTKGKGSRFTLQRITGSKYPTPVIDCDKTPAP